MKRGFTVIELLVVISIVSLLSSILVVATTTARGKGRDAQRISQAHQIDLAIQLYMASNQSRAPGWSWNCGSGATDPTCVGTLSTTTGGSGKWSNLQSDLSAYMPGITKLIDPCGSSCGNGLPYSAGYTYVAPAAMQAYGLCSGSACDSTYQIYTNLEKSSTPIGYSPTATSGTSYYITPMVTVGCAGLSGAGTDNTLYTFTSNLPNGYSPTYTWTATGGASPSTGNSSTFSTTWPYTGYIYPVTVQLTVTSGGQTSSCSRNINIGPTQQEALIGPSN